MKYKLMLISGAGNTFHVLRDEPPQIAAQNRTDFVVNVCKTYPADGFIFLKSEDNKNLFSWDFYNNDGSVAEMCGNASRCVGFFIKNKLRSNFEQYQLKTLSGMIHIYPESTEIFTVQMTEIIEHMHEKYFYCNTGVPHIVIEINNFSEYKTLTEKCRELRNLPDFHPKGTNVTLIAKTEAADTLLAVTYERGVEDFTAACGTGAMAAAFYNFKKHEIKKTKIKMPGGDLHMDLTSLQKPLMRGPAIKLGEYEYEA